jgi:hypothetical protein
VRVRPLSGYSPGAAHGSPPAPEYSDGGVSPLWTIHVVSIDFVDPIIDLLAGLTGGSAVREIAEGPGRGSAAIAMAGAVGGLIGGLLLEGSLAFFSTPAENPGMRELIGEFIAACVLGAVVAAIFRAILNKVTNT